MRVKEPWMQVGAAAQANGHTGKITKLIENTVAGKTCVHFVEIMHTNERKARRYFAKEVQAA